MSRVIAPFAPLGGLALRLESVAQFHLGADVGAPSRLAKATARRAGREVQPLAHLRHAFELFSWSRQARVMLV